MLASGNSLYSDFWSGSLSDDFVGDATKEEDDNPPPGQNPPTDVLHRKYPRKDEFQNINFADKTNINTESHKEVIDRVSTD